MIVSFSVSNFRSFAGEETFSLVSSNRFIGDHENHMVPVPNANEKVLRTGVVYGANGAGKSNLFKALSYLRSMVLDPRKKGSGTGREHFRFGDWEGQASVFDLQFIVSGKLYRFGLKVDDQRIAEEWLVWIDGGREKTIYERLTDSQGKVIIDGIGLGSTEKLKALATVGGPQNQTFLATIRATLDSPDYGEELGTVLNWFDNGLVPVAPDSSFFRLGHLLANDENFLNFAGAFLKSTSTGVDHLNVTKRELSEEQLGSIVPEHILSDIIRDTDENVTTVVALSSGLELLVEKKGEDHFFLLTVQTAHQHEDKKVISLDLDEESDGTQRLLNLLPALYQLQMEDTVYFIDEIDRSMHPLLVWKFLEFFLNSCENNNSQVLVTTHESNLLDLDLLRRDEIWFAEKDQKGATKLYSLADYQVRKDLEIRKHYLKGRFGAVPFLGNLDRLLAEEGVPV